MNPSDLIGQEISVPASIANLGPGFDTLAVAVQLYLRVRIVDVDEQSRNTLTFDFVDQKLQGENYIERAFRYMAGRHSSGFPLLALEVRSEIPMQAGLGSSAAATVAGLKLFEKVVSPLWPEELLTAACLLEGHPDNVSAALLGGLTGSCQLPDSVMAVPWKWPEEVRFIVLTPEVGLATAKSRCALPQQMPRSDAVFNLQRVVLFLQVLQSGDHYLLREALRDKWHQPVRQPLVPGLEQALSLEHPDLLGVCLSGAGPSIVALAEKNFGAIEDLLSRCYATTGIPFQVRTLRAHDHALGLEGSYGFRPVSHLHGGGKTRQFFTGGTESLPDAVSGERPDPAA